MAVYKVAKLSFVLIFYLYQLDCQGQSKKDSVWIQTSDGCKVYNPHPVKNETITWSGECVDGYANGEGTLTWFKKGAKNQEYSGQMKRGQPHGRGKYDYLDGEIHEGEYVKGDLEGHGRVIERNNKDSITYYFEGEFKDGSPQGYGEEIYFYAAGGDTSSVYKGNLSDWYNRNGHGVLKEYYNNSVSIAIGEFINNRLEGEAEIRKYTNKKLVAYYKGNYQNGGRNGYGEEVFGHNKYLGEWKKDQKEGKGKLILDSVLIYDGEWKNDKFNGLGKRFFFDGSYYVGEFKNNQRDGFGVLYWKDGTRYVGEFKKELFNGRGYLVKGTTFSSPGIWENGALLTPEFYDLVRQRLEQNHKDKIQLLNITWDAD